MWDEGTSFNTIQGNYIGINLEGTETWGHPRDGIHSNGASYNLIRDNVIGGNGSGIYLCCVADGHNTVTANIIGTDASGETPLGNQEGVLVDHTSHNVIGPGNFIAYNRGTGITFGEDTLYNTVTRNSIHDNGELGVTVISASDARKASPLIFEFDLQAGTVTRLGCPNCIVEIFSDSSDQAGIYEGRTVADGTGFFRFSKGAASATFGKGRAFTGPRLTTNATDPDGSTTEFSRHTHTASGILSTRMSCRRL